MRTHSQAGAAERTAATPADIPASEMPAAGRGAEEFSARRRGLMRRYLYNHPRVMDLMVVAAYLLAGSATFLSPLTARLPVHAALMLAGAVVLMFRRSRPLTVLAALSVLEVVSIILVPTSGNIGTSLWFGLYAVAVTYRSVFSFVMAALASFPLVAYMLFFYQYPREYLLADGPSATASNIISVIVLLLTNTVATGVGASVRRGREHEAELRSWAIRNAQLASVAERNRIAREMHDVVAHSLTVMVALSDGAAVAVKRNPEQAGEVLGRLSETGRTALSDMRRVLGVLRDDAGSDGRRAPQPDHSDLRTLVDGFRQAGLPLVVTQSGPSLPEDPALALTVYRIVQESLTNVLRYGTSVSRVQVVIGLDAGTVRIQVSDDGHGSVDAPVGAGQGIVGMRERAGIFAGTVDAGPSPGGWTVEALLHLSEGTEKP